MNISSAVFECSAPDLDSCPDETLPEFAFIGRSNVGKSSLLNLLAGHAGLARVSPTPGFTKLINFFTINKTWRLVDLPGYGYAHVAREHKSKFNAAVAEYLQRRANLCCVFALIDSSLPPQKVDLEFVEWLTRNTIPFVLVFTKTDKTTPKVVRANIEAFRGQIAGWFEKLPQFFSCSSTARHGRGDLLRVIEISIAAVTGALPADADTEPTSSGGADDNDRASRPKTGRKVTSRVSTTKRPNPGRPW